MHSNDYDDDEESVRLNFRHSDKLTLVSLSVTNVRLVRALKWEEHKAPFNSASFYKTLRNTQSKHLKGRSGLTVCK